MSWTNMTFEARLKAIAAAYERGLTFTQIATEVGAPSRNFIAGMWHRHKDKIVPKVEPASQSDEPAAPSRARSKPSPPPAALMPAPALKQPKPVPVKAMSPLRRIVPPAKPPKPNQPPTLMTAGPTQCRFPLWSDRGPVPTVDKQFICGAPVERAPYCGACADKIFIGRLSPSGKRVVWYANQADSVRQRAVEAANKSKADKAFGMTV